MESRPVSNQPKKILDEQKRLFEGELQEKNIPEHPASIRALRPASPASIALPILRTIEVKETIQCILSTDPAFKQSLVRSINLDDIKFYITVAQTMKNEADLWLNIYGHLQTYSAEDSEQNFKELRQSRRLDGFLKILDEQRKFLENKAEEKKFPENTASIRVHRTLQQTSNSTSMTPPLLTEQKNLTETNNETPSIMLCCPLWLMIFGKRSDKTERARTSTASNADDISEVNIDSELVPLMPHRS